MTIDDLRLIGDLSQEYTDMMCAGDNDRHFSRGCIAAAYMIGAEETLHRVCNVIRYSAEIGGISAEQSARLLKCIEVIESKPNGNKKK